MKSQFDFDFDADVLNLILGSRLHAAYERGDRVIWNNKGMRGVIPPAILESQFGLMSNYDSRLRSYDRMPEEIGQVNWGCVVLVPAPAHPTSHPTGEDA